MVLGWLALCLGFTQPATDVAAMVDRLNAPEWVEREAAAETLATTEDVSLDAIAAALGRADLSAEQRVRLVGIAAARFRFEPMGGLGVSFGSATEGAVQILDTVKNGRFPASDILRPADVIVAVGDTMIGGQDHLRAEILSRRPGEVLSVLVRRERVMLRLELPLGRFDELDGAASLDDETIAWATRLRLERAGISGERGAMVGSGLTGQAWVDAAFPEGRATLPPGETGERRGAPVAVGGAADDQRTIGQRGFWPSRADAARSAGEQLRSDLGRRMTSGVRLRALFVEHERTLLDRIAAAPETGEDAAGLEADLARVRQSIAAVDVRLGETARALDAAQP